MKCQVRLAQEAPVDSICDLVQDLGAPVADEDRWVVRELGNIFTPWKFTPGATTLSKAKLKRPSKLESLDFIGGFAAGFLPVFALMNLSGFELQI